MNQIVRPRRSVLYMPGSNLRALEKARSLAADCLILDLEDSVAPDGKAAARQQIVDAVRAGGYGHRELIIRVNALDTPWGAEDLAAAAEAAPDAVLVPKVSSPGDINGAADALTRAGAPHSTKLWAMMETPLAMINSLAIAASAADPTMRLSCFVMGTNDLAKDTRARLLPGRAAMLSWLSTCVAAARAYGLEIIDGVYNDFRDVDGFRSECQQGLEFGMDGKTLIHPGQIGPCNEVFSPSPQEVDWAMKIIAAFEAPENDAKGVIQLDGKMVERLHAVMAERTVAISQAIAAADQAGG